MNSAHSDTNVQPTQGKIIEEHKARASININLPKIHLHHPTFLSAIGGLSFLAIVFIFSYKIYLVSFSLDQLINNQIPSSTGAILGEKNPEQISLDTTTEELISLCPLETEVFSLEFSFVSNSFVIHFKENNQNSQSQFLDWLNNSKYRNLPANYFTFTN